jgi:excinuclease UvrABC nuclease subunit
VTALGGVKQVKTASREDLAKLTWLPSRVADAVFEHFNSAP